jgi:hypothetical protein
MVAVGGLVLPSLLLVAHFTTGRGARARGQGRSGTKAALA